VLLLGIRKYAQFALPGFTPSFRHPGRLYKLSDLEADTPTTNDWLAAKLTHDKPGEIALSAPIAHLT
jgi:hypothetical protein